ncbi:response regulator, partial [Paracraurococcus ruber]
DPALPPAAPARPAASPAAGTAAGPPVLLVEDETALRRLGTRVLERDGHAVLAADCAEAALALVEAGAAPCLLVSDVAMPGMDGIDLARAVRARFPALPVLLLSGYAERALDADFAAQGYRFLAKPFAPADLAREVAAALGRAAPAAA